MKALFVSVTLLAAATLPAAAQRSPRPRRLPTGVSLAPVGTSIELGSFPLALTLSPDRRYAVVLMSGWREQGVQVVDRRTGTVVQTLRQRAAFVGVAFSPDGRTLYASGGDRDVVYRYAWRNGRATLRDSLDLTPGVNRPHGVDYPAGLAPSPDGRFLYVAENLADSLAVFDVATGRVVRRYPTGRYPYGVAVTPDGTVYVSNWDDYALSVFLPDASGVAVPAGSIRVGRHPSALALSPDGSRLFVASGSTDKVAVVDTRNREVVSELSDAAPKGPAEGSTPDALAVSADGRRLFVAEADNNAVAVFDLAPVTGGYPGDRGVESDHLAGRIPVGWYPTALAVSGDSLLVVNAKGVGSAPNPGLPQPGQKGDRTPNYTLGQLSGTLSTIPLADTRGSALARHTTAVVRLDNWNRVRTAPHYPPFEHVIYIIKENRTYDQVLGDLPEGDGDTSLVFFPRPVTPNEHALAMRFGDFDRFFVNAEVSADGHDWSTAAYAPDYVEKTLPSNYGGRGRSYDYDGTNRNKIPADQGHDDVDAPANGYLWTLAERAGITFRDYGEFVSPQNDSADPDLPPRYRGAKPYLDAHADLRYPPFDLGILDQVREKEWLREFRQYEAKDKLPALEIIWLPSDHTSGGAAGMWTPRAYVASNDLALGDIVQAVSRSRFWAHTVIFVLEDDAQDGPDHVDSHRSTFFAISPYSRPGVQHRFTNTTDVVATIADILHLGSLSQYDYFGRPLRDIWMSTPNLSPYTALTPAVSLDERNPKNGPEAVASRGLDLRFADVANEQLFNRVLWRMIKGPDRPYPGPTRMSGLEWKRAH